MNPHPTISVVITTYNRAAIVGHAIESALGQTVQPHEVIVVDDGSIDDTPAVLAAFGDRIRVIRQANGGVSQARNAGVLAARGEWVALLDDDDEWLPDRLARAVQGIQLSPEADVHAGNTVLVAADGTENDLFSMRGFAGGEVGAQLITRPLMRVLRNCFFLQACVVRRSAYMRAGFRPVNFEDLDMLVRLADRPWTIASAWVVRVIRRPETVDSVSAGYRRRPLAAARDMAAIQAHALHIATTDEERREARTRKGTAYLMESRELRRQLYAGGWLLRALYALASYPTARSRAKVAVEVLTLGFVAVHIGGGGR